mmetsp:Transcript_3140/g.19364  ORF Transcript_3140/g.19364 Transcript_3140/m.19364 type:complete len:86 (-) Transcript_3140:437-694(-)
MKTEEAVAKWQASQAISPAKGYFGYSSRKNYAKVRTKRMDGWIGKKHERSMRCGWLTQGRTKRSHASTETRSTIPRKAGRIRTRT